MEAQVNRVRNTDIPNSENDYYNGKIILRNKMEEQK
ncbi:MAG: hypothetical protein K0R54_2567 [Clostridiaceae bacterium]|jgi:hypothetical protein|nr:hypothetical protein [Clostridiaceae bacterium]